MSLNDVQGALVDAGKKRAWLWLLSVLAPVALPLLGVMFVVIVAAASFLYMGGGATGSDGASAQMQAIYQSDIVKQECPTLPSGIIPAIIHIESRDNQNPGPSNAGAMGASQFMPTTWDKQGLLVVNVGPYGRVPDGQGYGLDGDGDGLADINNPKDSIPATARMLCANGGGNPATLPMAIFAYNHSWTYVQDVLSLAKSLEASSAGNGVVMVLPGANRPGVPIQPETLDFLQRVAGIYGKPLNCSVGSRHDQYSTDGLQSDHWTGNACDFFMSDNGGTTDGTVGDEIATACLLAAGYSSDQASQSAFLGGLYTIDGVHSPFGTLRVQCIWKTFQGGNHHDHVHIGVKLTG